jgi:hypothetical protein
MSDPKEDCENLAEPMGQFIGGAAAVPAFAAAAAPYASTGPGAIVAGTSAAYGVYELVGDAVTGNWDKVVCEPLADAFKPESDAKQVDWNATSAVSSPESSPYDASIKQITAPPVADVIIFDNAPSAASLATDSSGGGGFYGSSSAYDSGSSAGSAGGASD